MRLQVLDLEEDVLLGEDVEERAGGVGFDVVLVEGVGDGESGLGISGPRESWGCRWAASSRGGSFGSVVTSLMSRMVPIHVPGVGMRSICPVVRYTIMNVCAPANVIVPSCL